MSRFVLRPCRIREDRFVHLDAEPPLVLTAAELVRKFVPERGPALQRLRFLRVGAYCGTILGAVTGSPVLYVFMREDRKNSMRVFLRQDPLLSSRILDSYYVEEADWGSRFEEPVTGKKDQPAWELPGSSA